MIKKFYMLLLCAVVFAALASCGIQEPPQESEIINSLPADITTVVIENPFDTITTNYLNLDVVSVQIEKRQTNDKEDFAYCIIVLENDMYQFTKHLRLNYNYYDRGGWILDGYSEYSETEWTLKSFPITEDDAALALSKYSTVELIDSKPDYDNGIISYSFNVKDTHNNGAYTGIAVVECRFDGRRWIFENDTDDVHFVWDILGTWTYSKIEETSYDKTINEIEVTIIDFDQETGSMCGSWYMNSVFSFLGIHAETMKSLDDPERVQVGVAMDRTMVELWENPNYMGMHSYVRFYPDYVEADYATHFGPVRLERQTIPDTVSPGNNSGTSNEDEEIWNNLISEYFDMMETDDQDLILAYLLKAGPYGDEINIRGEHLTNYEITEVEHSDVFYASMHDKLENEIEMTKHYLAEIKPDFNIVVIDLAAVYVQAEFKNQNLGTVNYKFWFINNNGTWEMYYIDR